MRNSIVTIATALALVVGLTGCGAFRQQTDNEKCENYGWSPGTDKFANCMMALDQQRNALLGAFLLGGGFK